MSQKRIYPDVPLDYSLKNIVNYSARDMDTISVYPNTYHEIGQRSEQQDAFYRRIIGETSLLWDPEMNNFYTTEDSMDSLGCGPEVAIGVFDGHGKAGAEAALAAKALVSMALVSDRYYMYRKYVGGDRRVGSDLTGRGVDYPVGSVLSNSDLVYLYLSNIDKLGFDSREESDRVLDDSGTTATVAIIKPFEDELTVHQIGDSAAVWIPSSGDEPTLLAPMHDLTNPEEVERTVGRGLAKADDNYFYNLHNGKGMMLSRSLGDNELLFNSQKIDTYTYSLRKLGAGSLVLATDGLWGRDNKYMEGYTSYIQDAGLERGLSAAVKSSLHHVYDNVTATGVKVY